MAYITAASRSVAISFIDTRLHPRAIMCFAETPIAQKNPECLGGKVLLCIMSLSRSAVMKYQVVSHSPRCLPKPFLTSRRRLFLASATAADYATLCFQEGGGMEKSARRRVCEMVCVGGGESVCRSATETGRKWNPPYRCLSVCLLHSSFPPFLKHPLSLHFFPDPRSRQGQCSLECLIGCHYQRQFTVKAQGTLPVCNHKIPRWKQAAFYLSRLEVLNFQLCIRYLKHSGTFVLPDRHLLNDVNGFLKGSCPSHNNKGFLSGVGCVHWDKYFGEVQIVA